MIKYGQMLKRNELHENKGYATMSQESEDENMFSWIQEYIIDQINIGTILLLFCLMGVVAGFQYLGYIDLLAKFLVKKASRMRSLAICLTGISFFFSMLVTNDVALIIVVPFTISILNQVKRSDQLILLVVLETLAANLGSMMTPIGNPQNVYLYQEYEMTMRTFFKALLPYGLISLVLLAGIILLKVDGKPIELLQTEKEHVRKIEKKGIWTVLFSIMFVICLLTVLRLVPNWVTFICVVAGLCACNVKLLKTINYGLLGKFILLFLLVGNVAKIPWISNTLQGIVNGHEFYCGVISSQVVSNVPAAILLSRFTGNGTELMLGVDIGGLGTLIASMASMISLDFYGKSAVADKKKYILSFTAYNLIFLAIMILVRELLCLVGFNLMN